jgi:hypothetical protein
MKRHQLLLSRIGLVAVGVSLGLLARVVIGPPAVDQGPKRSIDRPMPETTLDEMGEILLPIDIPLNEPPTKKRDSAGGQDSID